MDVIKNFDLDVAGFEAGYPRSGKGDPAMQARAVELAKKADIVLLYVGLDEISESEGLDRSHMKLPQSQIDLLEAVAAANPNVVAVMSAGSAVEMPWLPKVKATGAWLPVRAGGGVLRAQGDHGPGEPLRQAGGELPYQIRGRVLRPLLPRQGAYRRVPGGPVCGLPLLRDGQCARAVPLRFRVELHQFRVFRFEGERQRGHVHPQKQRQMDGAEVAQLYVSKPDGGVFRPAKELKGFAKVFLKAGESKKVTIPLDDKAFRYFNVDSNRFEVEGGQWTILIGASCADIKLSGTVEVQGTNAASPYDRQKFAKYFAGDIKDIRRRV